MTKNWNNRNKGEMTRRAGHYGNIVEGKIEGTIPQYIKGKDSNEFKEITKLNYLFFKNESLIEGPKIPSTVVDMRATFNSCTNLQGTIEINANVTGKQLGEEYSNNIDYNNCLLGTTTAEGISLKVTGTCPMLNEIVTNANNPKITL